MASAAIRSRPSSVAADDGAPVVGVALLGRQPELDECLDVPADRALVEVERLDHGGGADRAALDHVGQDQVARRGQVGVDRCGPARR